MCVFVCVVEEGGECGLEDRLALKNAGCCLFMETFFLPDMYLSVPIKILHSKGKDNTVSTVCISTCVYQTTVICANR